MKTSHLISAALFSSLLAATAAWAGGDAAAGEAKAATCDGCHVAGGMAVELDGIDPAQFVEALKAFKSGEREDAGMQAIVADLTEEDFMNLAAYYSGDVGE